MFIDGQGLLAGEQEEEAEEGVDLDVSPTPVVAQLALLDQAIT